MPLGIEELTVVLIEMMIEVTLVRLPLGEAEVTPIAKRPARISMPKANTWVERSRTILVQKF